MALFRVNGGSGVKFKAGTFEASGSSAVDIPITLGFKPKYIAISFQGASGSTTSPANGALRIIYNEDYSNTNQYIGFKGGDGVNGMNSPTVNASEDHAISAINNTGFVYRKASNNAYNGVYHYFAVG